MCAIKTCGVKIHRRDDQVSNMADESYTYFEFRLVPTSVLMFSKLVVKIYQKVLLDHWERSIIAD